VVEQFSVDAILFNQNFDRSGSVYSDYASTTPDASQFNDIGKGANGGTFSISSGKLLLSRPTSTTAPGNGAGMTKYSMTGTAPKAVVLGLNLSLNGTASNASDIAVFELGSISSVLSDYNTAMNSPGVADRLALKGSGSGNTYYFRLNGVNSTASYVADGTNVAMLWYVNINAAGSGNISYTGPDGNSYSVAPQTSDLWANGTRIFAGAARNSAFTATNPTGIRIRTGHTLPMNFTFDELDLRAFP
jgi:hypothetical protein